MSFPRMLVGLVAGLLALSGLAVTPSSAQDAKRPVVGAVFGDSFASGEGLAGIDLGEAECQRALGRTAGNGDPSTAWGVTVLGDLPVHTSWFAACTGARTEHFKQTPQRTGLWPYRVKRDKTQYAEAVDGTGTERFDVVLASFGGNDLEFDKVIIDCIGIDDAIVGAAQGARAGGWAGGAVGGAAGFLTGRCQPGTDQDRREAIDRIAEENLPKLYNDLVDATTEGALIVVTGYPQLFEDPTTSWLQANALTRRCHGMHFDDADMIRGLAGRLNQAIGAEVKEAAKRHPERTWVFADVSFPFDGHGLCSDRAESWINGITTGLLDGDGIFDGDFRYKRSFHPTQEGHTEGYAGFISGFRQVEEWSAAIADPLVAPFDPVSASSRLSVDGFGPIKMAMPLLEAKNVAGTSTTIVDRDFCSQLLVPTLPGLTVLADGEDPQEEVFSIELRDVNLKTESGAHVGMTRQELKDIYGRNLSFEHIDHKYAGEAAVYRSSSPSPHAIVFIFEYGRDAVETIVLMRSEHINTVSLCS